MARQYYSLVVNEGNGFAVQFGDYDRASVEDEKAEMKYVNMGAMRDNGTRYTASDFKGFRALAASGDTQDAIDAAVARLNKKG